MSQGQDPGLIAALTRRSTTHLLTCPMLPVALGLVAGILADDAWAPSRRTYGAMLILILLASIPVALRGPGRFALIVLASFCAGGLFHEGRVRAVPADSIVHHLGRSRRLVRIRGGVLTPPRLVESRDWPFREWTRRGPLTTFLLETTSTEGESTWRPTSGWVQVRVNDPMLDLHEDDEVEVFGWLSELRSPSNPGAYDWARHFRRQRVLASVYCEHAEAVKRRDLADRPRGRRVDFAWSSVLESLRRTARRWLMADFVDLPPEDARFLEAMIIGQRSDLDRRILDLFQRSGCMHFLAVSGTNVAVLMTFVWLSGRLLGRSKRQCAGFMVLTIIAFAAVADPRPPILRATVMGLLFCAALLARRPPSHANWLSASLVILLLIDPASLFDAGLQLSFTAVVGVTYLAPALRASADQFRVHFDRIVLGRPYGDQDRLITWSLVRREPGFRARLGFARRTATRWIGISMAVSVAAWMATTPLTLWHFQVVNSWGWLSSVIVFPLAQSEMIVGLAKLLLTGVSPALGAWLVGPIKQVTGMLLGAVDALASLPGARWAYRSPPWWLLSAWYAWMLSWMRRYQIGPEGPTVRQDHGVQSSLVTDSKGGRTPRPGPGPVLLALTFTVLVGVVLFVWPRAASGRLMMTVLDVGLGSATIIELPDGTAMMYDAGNRGPSDVGRNVIVPFLRYRRIQRLDGGLIMSHANLDHYSGVPTVVAEIKVPEVITGPWFPTPDTAPPAVRKLWALLEHLGCPRRVLGSADLRWSRGGVEFEVLWPPLELEWGTGRDSKGPALNDSSIVLRVSYLGKSILLTGDIEEPAQRAILAKGVPPVDVMILPHHGSVTSTLPAFLSAAAAPLLIRSSHEPGEETFTGLSELVGHRRLFNTADDGAVEVVIDEEGVKVATFGSH